jgi:hypothetical protein
MKRATLILAALSVPICALGQARADLVYSNISATSSGSENVGNSANGPLANSFSTGASDVNLVDVQLLLYGTNQGGSIQVDLLSNFSKISKIGSAGVNVPGTVLTNIGTLNESSLSSSPSVYTFTLDTPYALSADTRYWIQLSDCSLGANWATSDDTSGFGVAGEFSTDNNGLYVNADGSPFQMEVDVTGASAPEPSSYLLFGLTLAGGGFLAWRRRRDSAV